MKMNQWSDYDKYIVSVDSGRDKSVQGVSVGYEAFLQFKLVKAALQEISRNPGKMYTYKNEIYKSPITQSRALQILEKLEKCKWDNDIRKVAMQIGAVSKFLIPRGRKKTKVLYELSDTEKLDG
jgi:hypothetical protein